MTSSTKILVFQPGKVGSTAVSDSLSAAGLGISLEAAHIISLGGLRSAEKWHEQLGVRELPEYITTGYRLLEEIRNRPDIIWKVITIFREPISRIISGFFQEAARIHPVEFPAHGEWAYEKVESFLLHEFSTLDPDRDFTFRWFDQELKTVFGIDVYDFPFDHDRGFIMLEDNKTELLVLQYEKLASAFQASIGPFLRNQQPIPLLRANDSSQKPYSKIYAYTLEHFRLPRAMCRALYSTRFAKHFYRKQERKALVKRWGR